MKQEIFLAAMSELEDTLQEYAERIKKGELSIQAAATEITESRYEYLAYLNTNLVASIVYSFTVNPDLKGCILAAFVDGVQVGKKIAEIEALDKMEVTE